MIHNNGYGEALAIVMSTLTDYIYKTRKELLSKKTESPKLGAVPLALKPQSLPGLGLTGFSVGGSRSASLPDAIPETPLSEAAAAALTTLSSGDSSAKETDLETEIEALNKTKKFE